MGLSLAALFASYDQLRMLLAVAVAALLERLGALRDARIGQQGQRSGASWMDVAPVPYVGPLAAAVECVGTVYYTRTQKRKKVGSAGLQHRFCILSCR